MDKREKLKELLEEIGDTIITEITSAETGSLYLIDEFYRMVLDKADIARMYTDKEFYDMQGGWNGFARCNNERNVKGYVKMLNSYGYEIDNIDMIEDATLFLNIKKTD